jgi:hypothetical protein
MPYRPDPHPFEGGSGTPLAQGLGSRHTFQPAGGVCRYVCRVSASPSSTLSIMHVVAKDTTQFASQMTDNSPRVKAFHGHIAIRKWLTPN